jgi:hypothetical protein
MPLVTAYEVRSQGVEGQLWPNRLAIGDQVRRDGGTYTITSVSGRHITLMDDAGRACEADVTVLLFASEFTVLAPGSERTAWDFDAEGASRERALWWESHILEVLTGLPADAAPDVRPRPGFDPVSHSLAEREQAKARELTEAGVAGASARSVRRKRRRYQAEGVAGLVDGRAGGGRRPGLGSIRGSWRQCGTSCWPPSRGGDRAVSGCGPRCCGGFRIRSLAGSCPRPHGRRSTGCAPS